MSQSGHFFPTTVVELTGPVSAKIQLENRITIRRHHDQLLTNSTVNPEQSVPFIVDQPDLLEDEHALKQEVKPQEGDMEQNLEIVRNYPVRNRGPPDQFE